MIFIIVEETGIMLKGAGFVFFIYPLLTLNLTVKIS